MRLYEIVDGQAREIVYDPAMFEFDKAGIDPKLMRDHVGFAGFRVQFVTDWKTDVAAFLGASYFRAVGGDTRQYGLSARAAKTAELKNGRKRIAGEVRSPAMAG